MEWTDKQKKQLIDKIEQSYEKESEYHQILKIIEEYDIKFTKNKSGYFIDFGLIDNNDFFDKVKETVDQLVENKKYIENANHAYLNAMNEATHKNNDNTSLNIE